MAEYAKMGDTVVYVDCGDWLLTNGAEYEALPGTDEGYVHVIGDDGVEGVFLQDRFRPVRPHPTESPIRTVTRRELVPGEYGSILVDRLANDGALVVLGFKTTGNIFPDCRSLFSADDLRSACMVLSQLAEFLDEDKGEE